MDLSGYYTKKEIDNLLSIYLKRGSSVQLTFYSNYGNKTAYISAPDSYGGVTARSDTYEHTVFTLQ